MWGKLVEAAIKAAFMTGGKEIQKHVLSKKAQKHGNVIQTISCTVTQPGVYGGQDGRVVITDEAMIFGRLGSGTLLSFDLGFSWSKVFPIHEFTYVITPETILFNMIKQEKVSVFHNGKNFDFHIPKGKGDLFADAISKARGIR
jgi:hypothetical protein